MVDSHLEILKIIPIKLLGMKANGKIFKTCSLGTMFLKTNKKIISKGVLQIRSNVDPSKVHN
jgi:hypothetical protein